MAPTQRHVACSLALAAVIASPPAAAQSPEGASHVREERAAQGGNEVDLFMERVLDNRASWRQLGDFILRETTTLELEAPSTLPHSGFRHEYEWYVREGVATRSPVRFDGVDIGEEERRRFEASWLREETRRQRDGRPSDDSDDSDETGEAGGEDNTVLPYGSRPEARFIEDAYYFTEDSWEPGNSYLVGRETLSGREVVRIEHYLTGHLGDEIDERINRGFNKTSLLTLWVDPELHQIVKYTFDNPGLDFLRFRWLARVDGLEATVEMTPIGDVWLPARMTISGRLTTALGEFQMTLTRELFDYREAETATRLRERGSSR